MLDNRKELVEALISRRRLIAGAGGAVLSTSLFSLVGCGGGGGHSGGASSGVSLPGTVTVPAGITNSGLTIVTGAGTSNVSSNGQFTAQLGSAGTQNVFLFDSAGNLILGGPIRTGRTALSTRSMAEFLAFNALGVFAHMGDISAKVWTLLESADLTALQTAIETAISTSGATWLSKAQPGVVTALNAFATSILGTATTGVKPSATASPKGIIVTPTDRVSGVQVSTDDFHTCTATNDFRRRTWLYSSPMTLTENGTTKNLPLSLSSQVLPATSGITSVLSSLASLAGGATFYTQTSVTVDTSLADSTATQETFNIWIVGPAGQSGDWTNVPPDVVTGWWEVTSLSIVVDYLIPWIANIVLPVYADEIDEVLGNLNSMSGGSNLSDLSIPLKDVLGILSSSDSIRQEAYSGDLAGAIEDSALLILNSTTFQTAIMNLIIAVASKFTRLDSNHLSTLYRGVMKATSALDLGASIFDAAVQVVDLASSKTVETFAITATPPKISITPTNPTVGFGASTTFTANLIGASSSSTVITYDWTVSGAGSLKNPTSGTTGTAVSTSGPTVSFVSPSSGTSDESATLTVTAYYLGPSNPNRQAIASTSTKITISSQVITYGTLMCGGRYDDTGRYYWGIWTKLPIPGNAVNCNELMYNFDDTAYWGTQIPCSGTYNATTKSWSWGGGDDIAGDGSDSGPAGSDGNLYFGLTGGAGPGSGNLSNDIAGTSAYMNSRFKGMIIKGTFEIGS